MGRLPSTGPSLRRHLRQQTRQAQRQQQSSAFNRSGTSVTAEDVTEVEGTLNVVGALVIDGTETVNGPLVVHGAATLDGTTTIGGNASIVGTLSLPAGIIGNDALTSPVTPQAVSANVTNFGVPVAETIILTETITIPAGFTSAVVSMTGRVFAYNPNSLVSYYEYLYARTKIGSLSGYAFPLEVAGTNGSGINVSTYAAVLTGLTGGNTFTITVRAWTGDRAWGAVAQNAADVHGSILWFR